MLKNNSKGPKKSIQAEKAVNTEDLMEFEKRIKKLSNEDLKDITLINAYKLAMTRAQLEAVIEILIKEKITTYEEIWKRTNEIFKSNK